MIFRLNEMYRVSNYNMVNLIDLASKEDETYPEVAILEQWEHWLVDRKDWKRTTHESVRYFIEQDGHEVLPKVDLGLEKWGSIYRLLEDWFEVAKHWLPAYVRNAPDQPFGEFDNFLVERKLWKRFHHEYVRLIAKELGGRFEVQDLQ